MTGVAIRREEVVDHAAIDEVHRLAFDGEGEVRLVRAVRETAGFVPELSLVAESEGVVIGHVMFSVIHVDGDDETGVALSLAPVGVKPAHQRRGIGSSLVRAGMEAGRKLGYGSVVVVGHPEYYPRFGFRLARDFALTASFDVPDEAFMAIELKAGALGSGGGVMYPAAFMEAM